MIRTYLVSFFFLLIVGCMSLNAQDKQSNSTAKKLNWNSVFDGTFSQKGIGSVRWMAEGATYSSLEQTGNGQVLYLNELSTADKKVLFKANELMWPKSLQEVPTIDNYTFSKDEKFVLLETNQERIWRRSRKADYFILNLENYSLRQLSTQTSKQSLAEFSPDYKQIAFIADNNLFVNHLNESILTEVTSDGKKNAIINGTTDWVYEEEFYLTKAWKWSKSSDFLLYLRFDESEVKEFSMERWSEDYPTFNEYKYPKAGEDNAKVSVWVYELASKQKKELRLGKEIKDWYVPRLYQGEKEHEFYLIVINRLQNHLKLLRVDAATSTVEMVYEEKTPYWLDLSNTLEFVAGKNQVLWLSDQNGFNHIYTIDLKTGTKKAVTSGNWDVEEVHGYDHETKKVYFTSSKVSAAERHLFAIDLSGKKLQQLTLKEGWHSINFSTDFSNYIDSWSVNDMPTQYSLYQTKRNKLVRELEANEALSNVLSEYNLAEKTFIEVPNGEGDQLLGYIIKPTNFDSTKQYPLLMFVYGGPRSQQVQNRFSLSSRDLMHHYLANKGVLIACVDGRGTGGRGRDFKKQVYKRLGELETADQIAAAEYFGELSYIDSTRIGIWGGSYGGYMSSLSLAKGPTVFKAAAAVAPVTHWKFYDTIYTERFMQTPEQNPEGYEAYAPIRLAKHIPPHSYLLIHGTADDNVHYQNAMAMTEALIQENIPFQMVSYPNRNHGLSGPNGSGRRHSYVTVRDFFLSQFNLPIPTDR